MTDKITSFIMVGVPGSGKSTYSKYIQKQYKSIIVSPDDIREELYGSADVQGEWNEIEEVMDNMIDEYAHQSIIIDATHCNSRSRKESKFKLEKYGHNVIAVVLERSLDICLQQNMIRDRQVPIHIIDKMFEQLSNSIFHINNEGFHDVLYV